ncbi:MAG TPA: hypothetical protein VIO36_05955 [Anaerolineaceae bacterium]
MFKVEKPQIIWINLFIIALGIIFILWGYLGASGAGAGILEAIGTGLIATGGVNLLDRLFTEVPKRTGVSLVSLMRTTMDPKIHERKDRALKIDTLGVSITAALAEIYNDSQQMVIKNILYKPKTRVRMMFLHPEAEFMKQRYLEDEFRTLDQLVDCQKKSLEYCVLIYAAIKKRYDNERRIEPSFEPLGSLVIKLIEVCPYVSMERYDDDLYWGIYTSDSPGKKAPVFLTTEADNSELIRKFKDHFEHLLFYGYEATSKKATGSAKDMNIIVRVGQDGPWLNDDLVRRLYNDDARIDQLLNAG